MDNAIILKQERLEQAKKTIIKYDKYKSDEFAIYHANSNRVGLVWTHVNDHISQIIKYSN